MLIKNGKVFVDGKFEACDIRVENGFITALCAPGSAEDGLDVQGRLVFPGFIDTHIHGACRVECGESMDTMYEICATLPRYGVTAFVPTPLADGSEKSVARIRNIRAAKAAPKTGAQILGMFLYTPYKNRSISYYAPPVQPTRAHTLQMIDGTFADVIGILVAPELEGGMEWCSWVSENGAMPVIGFSEGKPADITEAVRRGARLTDHFPNGFPALDHHVDQAVVQCLLEDDLYLQLNPDCIHVAPAFIRMILRMKGEDKVLAVSDSSALMGLPEGEYQMGTQKVFIRDGAVRNIDGKLVTGAHTYDENMRTLYQNGFSLETIGRIFSENAAKALRLQDRGLIAVGRRADLVIMSEDLYVQRTIIGGETVYQA